MWIFFAFGSAFFAGVTSILSKIGVKDIDSNLATAIRTTVVLVSAWLLVILTGSINRLTEVSLKTFIFLMLSGFSTGASWIFYFKALKYGDVNKVTPIDKSSTILTMVLSFVFLGESFNYISLIAMILMAFGTYMMIGIQDFQYSKSTNNSWFIYAVLSAIFASLTAILGKIGVEDIDSNLATAIRTVFVFISAWLLVFLRNTDLNFKDIGRKSWSFLILSGFATGFSWLCYYKALKDGPASVVVPIDKLSIVITVMFSYFLLKEKLSKKAFIGLILIVAGTFILI
ncbi:EamA family transporter [Anaerosphaera multitolerans]|uniref:EamA family transporter n=1 Tax=Anaerosphaera multitolerans TaxID=2487351 RepID=A0A437S693_9FIRM|nr:GRP family sugar transporter [Anaerosphaera multitolerans]RVU54524.1 EamA family transporter [Anaerosphaera multitolerans]